MIEIERLTQKQNASDCWHKARYTCVIASWCHEVMSQLKTLEKDETQNIHDELNENIGEG